MGFLDLKYNAFGLDISDTAVRVARLKEKGGSFLPVSFNEIPVKQGIVEAGAIKDEKLLASIIKNCKNTAKGKRIESKYVVASLPEKESFLVIIQMPKMSEKELKTAIVFEAENYIPLPLDSVYMDFEIIKPVAENMDHLDVLCVATPRKIVNSYVSAIKAAGLVPVALELESQSIARTLVRGNNSPFPVLMINIDEQGIDFVFFAGYSIRFTNTMAFSDPAGMTDKIKKEFSDQAGKLINYYRDHASHEHLSGSGEVKRILVSGKQPNLKETAEFLQKELKIETQLANPFANFNLPKNFSAKPENFMQYSAAFGLAMRSINIDKGIL